METKKLRLTFTGVPRARKGPPPTLTSEFDVPADKLDGIVEQVARVAANDKKNALPDEPKCGCRLEVVGEPKSETRYFTAFYPAAMAEDLKAAFVDACETVLTAPAAAETSGEAKPE